MFVGTWCEKSIKCISIIFCSITGLNIFFLSATIIAVAYIGTYVAKDFIPTNLSLFFQFLTFVNLHTSNSHISGSTEDILIFFHQFKGNFILFNCVVFSQIVQKTT